MPETNEPVYTSRDVERLIEVKALTEKMNNIQLRNDDLMRQLTAHLSTEEDALGSVKKSIERIHTRLDDKSEDLHECRDKLREENEQRYVSKAELEFALERTTSKLTRDISALINKLRQDISDNKNDIAKMRNMMTGAVLAVTLVGGVVQYAVTTYKTGQDIAQFTSSRDAQNAKLTALLERLNSTATPRE